MNIERLRKLVDIDTVVAGIADAVGRRPMLVYLMDELESQDLHDSRRGFERWPISRRQNVFEGISAPTLGLMGIRNRSASGGSMYLATATSKVASGPGYTRINLEQLSALAQNTWGVVKETCPSMVHRARDRGTGESEIHLLSKAESQQFVTMLAKDPDNHEAL